ncbi:MAG: PadR family transcriptional regulator, partial [Bacillus sp. (in: firmicutes)]
MDFEEEILRGYMDVILLSLLDQQSMYIVEISKEIQNYSDGKFDIKESTLFSSLKGLGKKEYIRSFWIENKEVGRRKIYEITDLGIMY